MPGWRPMRPPFARPGVTPAGPGGGIGRRAGFRCQWLNGRGGSSPLLGTTLKTAGVGPTSSEHQVEVTNYLHQGDLPAEVLASAESVAIDSETMGLRLGRDPLC